MTVFKFKIVDDSELTATKVVHHPHFFAEDVFKKSIKVAEEDRIHGLGGILERKLVEAGLIDTATPPQKRNRMLAMLEDALQTLGAQKLKKLGFSSGTTHLIRTGDRLKLSVLKEQMYRLR